MNRSFGVAGLALSTSALVAGSARAITWPDFTGPLPYQSIADSPYFANGLTCFQLETFEGGELNVSGLSANLASGASIVTAVGVPQDGYALQANGLGVIELAFQPPVTTAGLVWTGGDLLGSTLTLTVISGTEAVTNQYSNLPPNDPVDPADNRFFGVTWDVGIEVLRVTFLPFGGGVQNHIDHIQFPAASGDRDSDGDGFPDCNDGCPNDPSKIEPGLCGCGIPEDDSDGDGIPDCLETCLADIDGNGLVNAGDLGKLLSEWGDPCCGSDLTGDGLVDAGDIAVLLSEWLTQCPPALDAVSPSSGLLTGGTAVEITGSHLAAVSEVTFSGVPASEVTVIDGTRLLAVTPAAKTAGVVDIAVTTPFGTAVLVDAFQFANPLPWATVLEVEPDPTVITSAEWRERIVATGLPWRVRDNASGIEMLLVPPGTFMMGCSPSDQYGCFDRREYPVHEVTLTQPFYLGRYEVTQAQWTGVVGSNPSYFWFASAQVPAGQVPNRPVEKVSWNMIQGFEAETGLRLPTEAEWEYACRAGTPTAFNLPPNGTNADSQLGLLAWYGANSANQTRPVGQKQANNLGLHDMHGNVWEWCEDWYSSSYYSVSPPVDPPGPISGSNRVLRGGSWASASSVCRASNRFSNVPDLDPGYGGGFGFRVARTP